MLQALRNEIIVKPIFFGTDQVGQIVIPQSASQFKQYALPVEGEVISIGSKYPYKNALKPGDRVTWENYHNCGGAYEGKQIIYEGVRYLILKERWVHAKLQCVPC